MLYRILFCTLALIPMVFVCGCSQPQANPDSVPQDLYVKSKSLDPDEPRAVTVQHCLISFKGSKITKPISRGQEEALSLATELLNRARKGEDFDKIVEEFTDDSPPGIYRMVNHGINVPPPSGDDLEERIYQRSGLVPAFGDVGFSLEVGEVGMSNYHNVTSPYGFHIIKRIE